jgi:hypothetical protein
MYVFHNLLELTQAYVFFRVAENVSDKMAVVFFFFFLIYTMPRAFYVSKDRTVHETFTKLSGIMWMVKQRATAVCSPCSELACLFQQEILLVGARDVPLGVIDISLALLNMIFIRFILKN